MPPPDADHLEDQQADPAAGPQANIGEVILHAIARFPMTIVGCTVLGTLGAVVFAFSQPNQYRSVGMLLIRLGVREQQSPEGAVSEGFRGRTGGFGAGDELLLLANPQLQKRVVNKVGAGRILQRYDPRVRDGPQTSDFIRRLHDLQAWLMGSSTRNETSVDFASEEAINAAVIRVASGVEISSSRNTSTILVGYTSHEPEVAQLVTNAYLDVFQERHREIFETANELSFISEQRAQADEAASAAKQALRDRRERDGIYNLQARRDALVTEVQQMLSQNDDGDIQKRALNRQLDLVNAQLKDQEPDVEGTPDELPVPRVLQTFRFNALVSQFEQSNTQLAALEDTYAPGSDILRDEKGVLEARISRIQQQLAELEAVRGPERVLISPQQGPDPILAQLVSQQIDLGLQRMALEAGMESRSELIAERQARLDELVLLEPIYEGLNRAVTETDERAAQLARSHSQAQILRMIDADERMSNLIVTQEANLPTQKEGPDRLKFLGMGLFGGLGLGMALATLRQILDSRLRYPKGVEAALGLRVLGVVPEERRWRREGRRLKKAMTRPRATPRPRRT